MEQKKPSAAHLDFSDIQVGASYTFTKIISEKEVNQFAQITGDFNPLHCDPAYGKQTKFKKNIAHGMLVGSLFSTLVGMYCPGRSCLYLSQTLKFKRPIFFGDQLVVKGVVTSKSDSVKILTIKTEIIVNKEIAVSGEAKVTTLEHV